MKKRFYKKSNNIDPIDPFAVSRIILLPSSRHLLLLSVFASFFRPQYEPQPFFDPECSVFFAWFAMSLLGYTHPFDHLQYFFLIPSFSNRFSMTLADT